MSQTPAVPHKLVLKEGDKPLPSSYTRTRFSATEGVSSDISNIHIPALRNAYLNCKDSFLTFSVVAKINGLELPEYYVPVDADPTADPPVAAVPSDAQKLTDGNLLLDPSGACSFISSITILQNNVQIQHLEHYSKIHSMYAVAGAGLDSGGIRSLLSGSAYYTGDLLCENGTLSQSGTPVTHFGKVGVGSTKASAVCVTPMMTFAIPLMGLLSTCNLPLSMLSSGITIRINWSNDVKNSFYCQQKLTTTTTQATITTGEMTFTNVTFDGAVSVLDDASQLAVERENNYKTQPVSWTGDSYYAAIRDTTADELTTATTANQILGGVTYTSTKSILYGSFCKPTESSNLEPCNLSHIAHDSIRLRVNGVEYPRQAIDTLDKMVAQTAVVTGATSQSTSTGLMTRQFTTSNFRPKTGSADATDIRSNDRGVVGISLNNWPAMGATSGIDTRGGDCSAELTTTSVATTVDLTSYFVACFDVQYILEDGVLKQAF